MLFSISVHTLFKTYFQHVWISQLLVIRNSYSCFSRLRHPHLPVPFTNWWGHLNNDLQVHLYSPARKQVVTRASPPALGFAGLAMTASAPAQPLAQEELMPRWFCQAATMSQNTGLCMHSLSFYIKISLALMTKSRDYSKYKSAILNLLSQPLCCSENTSNGIQTNL